MISIGPLCIRPLVRTRNNITRPADKGGRGEYNNTEKNGKKKCSRGPLCVAEEKEITHTKNITQEMK
jgi:hypothetical protein